MCNSHLLQGTTVRQRSRSPRRSPARARVERGGGNVLIVEVAILFVKQGSFGSRICQWM